ncbi:LamG-like jellyroll fold domain-containing protein [Dactylosporangium sp. CA-152071]|uniref:LamG-like jellyroll fold domain-containing protein n=1 Tax=Dactylosporangium sp. CA-152071 TaxID=3239933 RepID=UPI003D8FD6C3
MLLPLTPLSAGRADAAQGNVLTAPIPGRSSIWYEANTSNVSLRSGECLYMERYVTIAGVSYSRNSRLPYLNDTTNGGKGTTAYFMGQRLNGSHCQIDRRYTFYNWDDHTWWRYQADTMRDGIPSLPVQEVFMQASLGNVGARTGWSLVYMEQSMLDFAHNTGETAGTRFYDTRMCPGSKYAVYETATANLCSQHYYYMDNDPSTNGTPRGIPAYGMGLVAGDGPVPTRYNDAVNASAPTDFYHLDESGPTVTSTTSGRTGSVVGSGRLVSNSGPLAAQDANDASDLRSCANCYLSIPSAPGSALEGNSSVELWFRSPGLGPDSAVELIGSGSTAKNGTYNWDVTLTANTGGGVVMFGGKRGPLSSNPLPDVADWRLWNHLVMTFDGFVGKMYVNGDLVATNVNMPGGYATVGNALVVG